MATTTRPEKVTLRSTKSKNVGRDDEIVAERGLTPRAGWTRRAGERAALRPSAATKRSTLDLNDGWIVPAAAAASTQRATARGDEGVGNDRGGGHLLLGLWRLDRGAEVGLLQCGRPMAARCATLPRADADPVILWDLPVVCPSDPLTGQQLSLFCNLEVPWYLGPTEGATKISKLVFGWQILCCRLDPSQIKQRFGGFERGMQIRNGTVFTRSR
ncbi:hypothetical protein N431DRAFT_455212 [Stipitochalara longipes BDJ]|nr:hypothetical protein N431DRAFT_455212 [Stipitochalara longipes BDJ]